MLSIEEMKDLLESADLLFKDNICFRAHADMWEQVGVKIDPKGCDEQGFVSMEYTKMGGWMHHDIEAKAREKLFVIEPRIFPERVFIRPDNNLFKLKSCKRRKINNEWTKRKI